MISYLAFEISKGDPPASDFGAAGDWNDGNHGDYGKWQMANQGDKVEDKV